MKWNCLRDGVLHSLGEADPLVAHVELGEELADEDVAEDPPVGHGGREVEAHEAGDALSLPLLGDLEDVVSVGQGERCAVEHEVDIGQRVDGVTVHEELAGAGDQLNTCGVTERFGFLLKRILCISAYCLTGQ